MVVTVPSAETELVVRRRLRASSSSSRTTGAVRNSLARRAGLAGSIGRRRARRRRGSAGRELHRQLLDQLERLAVVGIEGDDDEVGGGLAGDVDEELVARALGFEPDGLDAEQQIPQGSRVASEGSTIAIRCTSIEILPPRFTRRSVDNHITLSPTERVKEVPKSKKSRFWSTFVYHYTTRVDAEWPSETARKRSIATTVSVQKGPKTSNPTRYRISWDCSSFC